MTIQKDCVARNNHHAYGSQGIANFTIPKSHTSNKGVRKIETSKEGINSAINQLTSLVAGGRFARATKQYQKNPQERIEHCYQLAISEQADSFGDFTKKNQVQRKIDSLYSLNLLAQLATEIEWD